MVLAIVSFAPWQGICRSSQMPQGPGPAERREKPWVWSQAFRGAGCLCLLCSVAMSSASSLYSGCPKPSPVACWEARSRQNLVASGLRWVCRAPWHVRVGGSRMRAAGEWAESPADLCGAVSGVGRHPGGAAQGPAACRLTDVSFLALRCLPAQLFTQGIWASSLVVLARASHKCFALVVS